MNRPQVRRGMARLYVVSGDPFQRVTAYRNTLYDARTHDRGLWRTCW